MLRYLVLVFCLTFGCSRVNIPQKIQSVRVNICQDPQTLDPRKARDLTSITLMHMFFEGLTRVSKEGGIEEALAETIERSEDGLQYRFFLRESFWSNGKPVTSFDFAESWKSILDPKFPADISYQLYGIKNAKKAKMGEVSVGQIGVYTPDARTLIVELEHPIPYFLNLVSLPPFFPVPPEAYKDPSWAHDPKNYVCNGPFKMDSWIRSDQISALKNPNYWEAQIVKLDEIEMVMMGPDTEIKCFEENHIDWAGSPLSTIPHDAIQYLKSNKELKVSPFSATYFFRVNTKTVKNEKNPLTSKLFRKALALAIHREKITEHILQGGQVPAKSLVPPEMGLSIAGYFQDANIERARSLFGDALLKLDLTMEKLEPIQITYVNSERNAAIAQAIQKQWEEGLGIKVELDAIEGKIFFERISKGDYKIAAGSWTADFSDPINFLEVFKYKEASTNNTFWENSKYVDLLDQSSLCKSSEERLSLLREAEQILIEEMPIIPIFHYALNYLKRDGLEEVAISPLGKIDFRWAHLNPDTSFER